MSLRCFVARPGSPFAGTVPISLGLWTPDGPIRGDRVVFFDRPQAVDAPISVDGRVAWESRDFALTVPEVYERWRERDVELVRYRCLLVERGDEGRAVGAYYWLDEEPVE